MSALDESRLCVEALRALVQVLQRTWTTPELSAAIDALARYDAAQERALLAGDAPPPRKRTRARRDGGVALEVLATIALAAALLAVVGGWVAE